MRARGFVLTGGRSRRMGADKALLPYAGTTLAQSVARQVELATGSASLIGSPDLYSHLGYPCLIERYPGQGPLSGLECALSSLTGDEWALLIACDMPVLDAKTMQKVLQNAALPALASLATSPGGKPEPLCASYHASLLPQVRQALAEDRLAVHKLLNSIPFTTCEVPAAALTNVNTPEDWAPWSR